MHCAVHEGGHAAAMWHYGAEKVWVRYIDDGLECCSDLRDWPAVKLMGGTISGIIADIIIKVMARSGVHPDTIGVKLAATWTKHQDLFLAGDHTQDDRENMLRLLKQNPHIRMEPIIETLAPVILDFLTKIDLVALDQQLQSLEPGEQINIVRDPSYHLH